jgi:hypothetical protein
LASAAFRKWVEKQVTYLRRHFFLDEWTIGLLYDREVEEDESSFGTVAWIDVHPDYLKATINFAPFAEELFEDKKFETLMQCVTHEMCHIWTAPTRTFALKAVTPQTEEHFTTVHEQLTQRIAILALRGIPKKSYTPK